MPGLGVLGCCRGVGPCSILTANMGRFSVYDSISIYVSVAKAIYWPCETGQNSTSVIGLSQSGWRLQLALLITNHS